MLTLHYVDDKHLLLTFVVHRLIPRMVDEPEDDQDRFVEAVLLELPNGHVLARTTWHLHDHAQYLWALGHGQFLLRVRDNPHQLRATRQPRHQRALRPAPLPHLARPPHRRIDPLPRNRPPHHRDDQTAPSRAKAEDPHIRPCPRSSDASTDREKSGPSQLLPPPSQRRRRPPSNAPPPVSSKPRTSETSPPPPLVISPSSTRAISTGPSTSTPTPERPAELSPFDSSCRPRPDLCQPRRVHRLRLPHHPVQATDRRLQHARRGDVGAGSLRRRLHRPLSGLCSRRRTLRPQPYHASQLRRPRPANKYR